MAMSLAGSVSAVSLAACGVIDGAGGSSSSASPEKGDNITVGLLLPDMDNTRYQKIDYPVIKNKVLSLTHHRGKVLYANADGDAAKQSRQLDRMIADKVDVLLVDKVNAKAIAPGIRKAKDAGIPVIAYDRTLPGPIDAYVAFDTTLVGQEEGNALLDALGSQASSDKIIMINGPAGTDRDAAHLKEGALGALSGHVKIARSYDVADWNTEEAKKDMEQAIQAVGPGNIAGVLSTTDEMAGIAIDALKQAGVRKMPPVTGAEAQLSAVRRVITGDQLMSVYTSYPDEAEYAAEVAVAKVQGRDIEFDALTPDRVDNSTNKNIPSQLVPVVSLTKSNIKNTVIADGAYKLSDICTAQYESACAAVGLE